MDQDTDRISLRDAKPTDAPLVIWLEEVCMKDYATALWGRWHPSATVAELDLSNHQIIEYDGISIGCVALNGSDSCLFLARLFLAPDYRNKGIGAWVLRSVVKVAHDQGLPVRLSVLRTNPAAKFYLREGFCLEEETTERQRFIFRPSAKVE